MQGEKADTLISRNLIMTIVLALIIVLVILGLLMADFHGFFSNLPDFFKGKNGSRADLLENAIIYGIDVNILLNDGQGRCIVAEVPKFQEEDNDWLLDYGVKKWELVKKDGNNWKEVNTGIEWITKGEIGSDLGGKIKEQVIRQDLIKECYLDDNDFEITAILNKRTKLLLKDNEKRCIVYESEEPDYEYYGIKKTIFSTIPYILENRRWVKKEMRDFPSSGQADEVEIAQILIEKEKIIKDYLAGYDMWYCGKGEPSTNLYCLDYAKSFEGLGEKEIYIEKKAHYYLCEKGKRDECKYLMKGIYDEITEINNQDSKFIVSIGFLKENAYLKLTGNNYGSGVRDGKISYIDGKKHEDNKYLNMDYEQVKKLITGGRVIEELIKKC